MGTDECKLPPRLVLGTTPHNKLPTQGQTLTFGPGGPGRPGGPGSPFPPAKAFSLFPFSPCVQGKTDHISLHLCDFTWQTAGLETQGPG